MYDLIIIGAGPIGLACAIHASINKLSYLVIEKGCLVNSIYNYPANMVFFSTSDRMEIGEVPFISHGVKPNRTEALEYFRRIKSSWNLNVNTYEKVNEIKSTDSFYKVITSKSEYNSKKIIIATGFYDFPNLLNIAGESLSKCKHYFDDAHPYADQKVLVVGGGNSAVDAALETFRKGAEVSILVRGNSLDDGIKYWVRPDIENRIREGSINAYFNSGLISIHEKFVEIETGAQTIRVENDFVLAMTGYHPDFGFLENVGIQLTGEKRIPVYNSDTFESNLHGVYLAGVVCGGMETGKWFIENSRSHAERIINHIVNSIGSD
jgi:thioredoxin reductase (NADPH)